ncbi:hypothetical protein OHA72_49770 [Dactylosporangium sp. NBC_01737]|uniref:hypothetical protein n=1 Tax=Dactylosporangium sp. NBC_01737 TaxID=2975959 RepID=UPI002E1491C1|nr:hypothetical protein OHA72_49770 [Dactylosporangium sp. NBC_01737]
MGSHSGPVRVYGPPWLRWPGPDGTVSIPLITVAGLFVVKLTAFEDAATVIVTAAVVATLWALQWLNRWRTPHVSVTDRFHWERADAACWTVIEYLPRVTSIDRKEVRSVLGAARWDLARAFGEQERLADMQRATRSCASALPDDDPLRRELDRHDLLLAGQIRSVQATAGQRVDQLRRMAAQCTALAAARARREGGDAAQARRTLTRVDASIAGTAVEAAKGAEAVLAAYQELGAGRATPGPARG